jgi:protocatechuate 3,4-dioxygenase beta subunit
MLVSVCVFAHDVTGYTPSCGSGPQYTITATVVNVNSSSNYRWQWKNSSGAWVCFVNGANTINGNSYNVSGAVYNLTTTPGPLVFTNPNSGLQGLEVRMVISDGNGVNPCNLPLGNTWTSATNFFINVNSTPCAGPCTGRVTSLYFNKLDGGTDLPISNGAIFTPAQLNSLYNLEAGTTGSVGSVKYTITGPTPSTNTENAAPYNSPATGGSAWTGANGTYNVNLKTYSGADGSGTLCHDTTISFLLTTYLELGNRVWYDANNNGINEAGENGIANITVRLYNDGNNDNVADGAAIATDITDGSGNYSFTGLTPGNYIVGVVVPNGYTSSSVNGGDPDNNINLDDNGQVSASGNEIRGLAITLAFGTEPDGSSSNTNNNVTYDFGLLPDCACANSAGNLLVNPSFESGTTGWSWSGGSLTTGTGYIACGSANGFNNWSSGTAKVWQDVNMTPGSTVTYSGFAGTHTGGIGCSPKLSLIFLNAAGTVISQTDVTVTRDVDVNFSQLEFYTITAVAPPGTAKVRAQNSITCNTLKIDAFCLTATPPASLGDRVWKDDNSNGIQDAGEVGVAGVTLVLYNSAGQIVGTTTTDATGFYKFSNLAPGSYTVRVSPPANYTLSPKTQGSDTNLDSDFDVVSYTTGTVTLTAGQNRTDIDAGLKFSQNIPASVGDRVWLDTNGDGIQDSGEPGVSDVLVTLYNSAGVAVASMYTDASGLYLFTNVAPGNYTVGVSLPPAMVFSPNNGAVSVANNSDVNPANGRTASFTVNAGDQIRYVDAGIKPQTSGNASVGDYVWNDLNKNGVQEAGEPGIPGVTVRLVNATTNTVVATTATDATGYYIFNDVVPGSYLVEFVAPSGYTTTTKLNASPLSSATDSDADAVTGRTASFTVNTGARITTVDAGYWVSTPPGTAKLGDRVWYDLNQNGIQDAGEPSVSGVTVTLYNSGGTAIKQASTDQNGNYLFTDLAAGSYSVGFGNLPFGYTFTLQGQGTAATGSDANPATGRTGTVTLVAGQTNLDVDAGIRSAQAGLGSLGNRVWYDLNNNGLQDAGEVGVQGVTVELLDAAGNPIDKDPATAGVQPTVTTTNALGEYLFTGLNGGEYKVRFSTLPAGYVVVAKNAGTNRDIDSDGNALSAATSTTDVITLAENQERLDIDLGIYNSTAPLGQLGDRVWFDANNNGVQDATEAGVPGVSVTLLDAAGLPIRSTVTDKDGLYKFVNLADGTYTVQFGNLPAGFSFSPKDLGGNDATDSDADPTTGKTGTYTISGGNSNMTVDAGIYSTRAALGDYVWFDADSDGIQDATEAGIPGVTVILYNTAGTALASAITDQNGKYYFSNLTPGTYVVGFSTTPGKLVFTLKDVVAAGDAADSDADATTGKTGNYTLAAGQVNLTVDAGLKPVIPASVGDYVWFDLNRDGLQDVDEPGVPGVVATLYNSANQPIGSAVTDGNGYYLISNVPPGTGYYVKFSNLPDPSAQYTLQNVGGVNAANNSKADATGQTSTFSVAEGQNITNIDAGVFKIINLTGNVWHDVNAMSDGFVNNSGAAQTPPAVGIPVGLRAYLVNTATGLVEQVTFVNTDNGTFSFFDIAPNSVYSVVLSSSQGIIGTPPPASILPNGWIHTGQKNANPPNSPAGSDGLNDGILIVPVGTTDVINVNFGIRLRGGDVVLG